MSTTEQKAARYEWLRSHPRFLEVVSELTGFVTKDLNEADAEIDSCVAAPGTLPSVPVDAAVQQGVQPVAHLRFMAWQGSGSPETGPEFDEGFEVCDPNEKGSDGSDAFPVYAHPTQQVIDAQRWQIVNNRISGEYIAGRAHFVVQLPPVPDTNIMRGSVAEHFTKAVDFAVAQAKQGEQANG